MIDSPPKLTLSFIIPVLNGAEYIGRCLDHIIREMDPEDEIIVVDNGSTDNTLSITRQYKSVTILEEPGVTIAALRNHGAAIAGGEILAFIDSDCLVCENWRKNVESAMNNQEVTATGSRYDIPDPSTWVERAWCSAKVKHPTRVNYINSGNLIVRRDAFRTVGGFDDHLITDEDFDFGLRLCADGYNILEVPAIRVIHLGNAKTLRQFLRKVRWHSTGGIKIRIAGRIDKPMIMTIGFILSWLFAICWLWLAPSGLLNPLWAPVVLLVIPTMTAVYRIYQYRNYRYFFSLVVLYFVYFFARSVTTLQVLFGRPSRAGTAKHGRL